MLKYSLVEVLVGILVSAVVVLIGSLMVERLSHSVRFYNKCHTIKASFADVDGLRVGSDVRISGVNVGSVTSVRLDQYNVPLLEMCIDRNLHLPVDSSAYVTYADLLGKRYIEITPGADDKLLEEGSSLYHTSTAVSISALLDKVVSAALDK